MTGEKLPSDANEKLPIVLPVNYIEDFLTDLRKELGSNIKDLSDVKPGKLDTVTTKVDFAREAARLAGVAEAIEKFSRFVMNQELSFVDYIPDFTNTTKPDTIRDGE